MDKHTNLDKSGVMYVGTIRVEYTTHGLTEKHLEAFAEWQVETALKHAAEEKKEKIA